MSRIFFSFHADPDQADFNNSGQHDRDLEPGPAMIWKRIQFRVKLNTNPDQILLILLLNCKEMFLKRKH